jgi:ribonuclease VapC
VTPSIFAVDSSAIVAAAFNEPDATRFHMFLFGQQCVIGSPTILETHMVLSSERSRNGTAYLDAVLSLDSCEVIDFTADHMAVARLAFDRYGKGRNARAALNFGDCMSYAVAKLHGIPLLFKGGDFRQTDIEPALTP